MKLFKQICSMALVLIMLLQCVGAFADNTIESGTITAPFKSVSASGDGYTTVTWYDAGNNVIDTQTVKSGETLWRDGYVATKVSGDTFPMYPLKDSPQEEGREKKGSTLEIGVMFDEKFTTIKKGYLDYVDNAGDRFAAYSLFETGELTFAGYDLPHASNNTDNEKWNWSSDKTGTYNGEFKQGSCGTGSGYTYYYMKNAKANTAYYAKPTGDTYSFYSVTLKYTLPGAAKETVETYVSRYHDSDFNPSALLPERPAGCDVVWTWTNDKGTSTTTAPAKGTIENTWTATAVYTPKTFKFTYNYSTAKGDASTYETLMPYADSAMPTRTSELGQSYVVDGYTYKFIGWKLNGTSTLWDGKERSEDTIFTAVYEKPYEITYTYNVRGDGTATATATERMDIDALDKTLKDYTKYQEAYFNTTDNVSYTFKDWYDVSTGNHYTSDELGSLTVSGDMAFKANYNQPVHLTFNVRRADGTGRETVIEQIGQGEDYKAFNDATKWNVGVYTFKEWRKGSESGEIATAADFKNVLEDATYYAVYYDPMTVKFTYYGEDGNETTVARQAGYSQAVETPNVPDRTVTVEDKQYTVKHIGWSAVKGGSTLPITTFTKVTTDGAEYFAVYSEPGEHSSEYKITFMDSEGKSEIKVIDSNNAEYDGAMYVPMSASGTTKLPTPATGTEPTEAIPGKFIGWSLAKPSRKVLSYINGLNTVTYSSYEVNGNVTFYATYRQPGAIFYDDENNMLSSTYQSGVIVPPSDSLLAYNRDQFEMIRWKVSPASPVSEYLDPGKSSKAPFVNAYADGGKYSLILQRKTYTVTYLDENGAQLGSREYLYGESATKPDGIKGKINEADFNYIIGNSYMDADNKTHIFMGWEPNGDYRLDEVTVDNIQAKAKFTVQDDPIESTSHIVTYYDAEGNSLGSEICKPETKLEKASENAAVAVANYKASHSMTKDPIFINWEVIDGAHAGMEWDPDDIVDGNYSIRAVLKTTYTETFVIENAEGYETTKKTVEVPMGEKAVEWPQADDTEGQLKLRQNRREFKYWVDEKNAKFDFNTVLEDDITLYAHYSDLYYVFYENASGSINPYRYDTDAKNKMQFTDLATAAEAYRDGCKLVGWSLNRHEPVTTQAELDALTDTVKATNIDSYVNNMLQKGLDVTLYAVWMYNRVEVEVVYWQQKAKPDRVEPIDGLVQENFTSVKSAKAYAMMDSKITFNGTNFNGLYADDTSTTLFNVSASSGVKDTYVYKISSTQPEVQVKKTGSVVNVFYIRDKKEARFRWDGGYKMVFNGGEYDSYVSGKTPGEGYNPYIIKAEIDENIEALWPYNGSGVVFLDSQGKAKEFYGWGSLVSKRVTMVKELDTTHRGDFDRSNTFYLMYMFESTQDEVAAGDYRVYSSRNYTISFDYTQFIGGSGGFSCKDISGMKAVNTQTVRELKPSDVRGEGTTWTIPNPPEGMGTNVTYEFLYYTRNRHYINVNMNDTAKVRNVTEHAKFTGDTKIQTMYGEKIEYSLPKSEPVRANCKFTGWYLDPECTMPVSTMPTMPDQDITIYAGWIIDPVTITYYYSETKEGDPYIYSTTEDIPAGELYEDDTQDPAVNVNYGEFKGWYYYPYEDKSIHVEFIPGVTIVDKDTEVFADWKNGDFIIEYNCNDGDSPYTFTDPMRYDLKTSAIIKKMPTVNEGGEEKERTKTVGGKDYVFVGWHENGGSSTTLFTPGSGYLVYHDASFVADWYDPELLAQIIYVGRNEDETKVYLLPHNTNVYASDDLFPSEGYEFKGWTTDKGGTEATIKAGEHIPENLLPDGPRDVRFLYGVYEPIEVEYAVHYYVMGTDGKYPLEPEVISTEDMKAVIGETVTAPQKNFGDAEDGFVENTKLGTPEATVAEDGSTVVSRFYERKKFTLTIYKNVDGEKTKVGDESYYYDEHYEVSAPAVAGYNATSKVLSGNMPAQDKDITFNYKKEDGKSHYVKITYSGNHDNLAENLPSPAFSEDLYDEGDPIESITAITGASKAIITIDGVAVNDGKPVELPYSFEMTMGDADIVVTVEYQIDEYQVVVNYYTKASAEASEVFKSKEADEKVKYGAPFEFKPESELKIGEDTYSPDKLTVQVEKVTENLTGDKALKVVYTKDAEVEITILYKYAEDNREAHEPYTEMVKKGEDFVVKNPVIAGYFTTNENYTGNTDDGVTERVVYYYEKDPVEIRFEASDPLGGELSADGGECAASYDVKPATGEVGTDLPEAVTVTVGDGFEFDGWYINEVKPENLITEEETLNPAKDDDAGSEIWTERVYIANVVEDSPVDVTIKVVWAGSEAAPDPLTGVATVSWKLSDDETKTELTAQVKPASGTVGTIEAKDAAGTQKISVTPEGGTAEDIDVSKYEFLGWRLEGSEDYLTEDRVWNASKSDAADSTLWTARTYEAVYKEMEIEPKLEVSKTAVTDKEGLDYGETVEYTITVSNAGNIPLYNVQITDEGAFERLDPDAELTAFGTKTIAKLGVDDEPVTYTVFKTVGQKDLLAGGVDNTVKVSASKVNVDGKDYTPKYVDSEGKELKDQKLTTKKIPTAPIEGALTVAKEVVGTSEDLELGDEVCYEITVTNTYNAEMTGIKVTDANAYVKEGEDTISLTEGQYFMRNADGTGSYTDTSTNSVLKPGEAMVVTAYMKVTSDHIVAKCVSNTVNVTADPFTPAGEAPSGTDTNEEAKTASVDTTVTPSKDAQLYRYDTAQNKWDTASGNAKAGDIVEYTLKVKNGGNVPFSSVTVTESKEVYTKFATASKDAPLSDKLANNKWEITSTTKDGVTTPALAVGETKELKVYIQVTKEDILATKIENTISVTGTYTDGEDEKPLGDDPATATNDDIEPEEIDTTIDATKTVTKIERGEDTIWPKDETQLADITVEIGDKITYAITVKNAGNVDMTGIEVTDTYAVADSTGAAVAAGEPVATAFDLAAGESLKDPIVVVLTVTKEMLAAKKPIKNVANITAEDVEDGAGDPHEVSGKAEDEDGVPTSELKPEVEITLTPVKVHHADGTTSNYDEETTEVKHGDVIEYAVTVKNTGNTDLTDVVLKDAKGYSDVACKTALGDVTIGALAVGETKPATAQTVYMPVKDADIIAGEGATNEVTVDAKYDNGNETMEQAKESHTATTVELSRDLTVTKTAKGTTTGVKLGDEVSYEITATNSGTVAYTGVKITDANAYVKVDKDTISLTNGQFFDKDGKVVENNTDSVLEPGETITIMAYMKVTSDHILAGGITNEVSVEADKVGEDKPKGESEDSKVKTEEVKTEIGMEKVATKVTRGAEDIWTAESGDDIPEELKLGDTITYTIQVKNSGNVPYTNIKVTDSYDVTYNGSEVKSGETICTINELAPGKTYETLITVVKTVTSDDIVAGTIANTTSATADAITPEGGTPSGTDNADKTFTPEKADTTVTPSKEAQLYQYDTAKNEWVTASSNAKAGDIVEYTLKVKNEGNVPYSSVTVTESKEVYTKFAATSKDAPLSDKLADNKWEITSTTKDGVTTPALAVDEEKELKVYIQVTKADILATKIENTISVNGTYNDGEKDAPLSEEDVTETNDKVKPEDIVTTIDATKTVTEIKRGDVTIWPKDETQLKDITVEIGDKITYEIAVENAGNVDMTGIEVKDIYAVADSTGAAVAVGSPVVTAFDLAAGESLKDPIVVVLTVTKEMLAAKKPIKNVANITADEITDGAENPHEVSGKAEDKDGVPTSELKPEVEITLTPVKVHHADGTFSDYVEETTEVKHGDVIEYEVTVKNTGNADLTDVVLKDAKGYSDPACQSKLGDVNIGELAVGETKPTTAQTVYMPVTDADIIKGEGATNEVTVDANYDGGSEKMEQAKESHIATTVELSTELNVTKDAKGTTMGVKLGDEVSYEITATNSGTVTYTGVKIKDANAYVYTDEQKKTTASLTSGQFFDKDGKVVANNTDSVLEPGETITIMAYMKVTSDHILAGGITNEVSVAADNVGGVSTPQGEAESAEVETEAINTTLTLDKKLTNVYRKGDEGWTPLATGAEVTTHDVIEYELKATNDGNVPMKDIVVTEDRQTFKKFESGVLSEELTDNKWTITELAVGEANAKTLKVYMEVTEADVRANAAVNGVTATGKYKDKTGADQSIGEVTPETESTDTKPIDVSMDVVKKATKVQRGDATVWQTGDALPEVKLGDTITYTITVKNTGNVDYYNIEVTDSYDVTVGGAEKTAGDVLKTIEKLEVGKSETITVVQTVTSDDILVGEIENTATAEADPIKDAKGDPIKQPDSEDLYVPKKEGKSDKKFDTEEIDTTLTLTKTFKEAYREAGDGWLKLDEGAAVTTHDVIMYELKATNDGNVPMKDVVVTEDRQTFKKFEGGVLSEELTDNTWTIDALAVGAEETLTVYMEVTEADVRAKAAVNGVTATGKFEDKDDEDQSIDEVTPETESTKTEPIDVSMDAVKKATKVQRGDATVWETGNATLPVVELGDTITYTITVKNTGNVDYHNIEVTDSYDVTVDGAEKTAGNVLATIEKLEVGKSETITVVQTVTSDDILAGEIENTATAKADPIKDEEGEPIKQPDSEDPYVPEKDATSDKKFETEPVDVTLTVNVTSDKGDDTVSEGDTITYTIEVVNDGNVPYENVVVVDNRTGLNEVIPQLNPGESAKFTTQTTVDANDAETGTIEYTVDASADSVKEQTPTGTATVTNAVEPPEEEEPRLIVTKTSDAKGKTVTTGDVITYTITVKNAGKRPQYNVHVDDDKVNLHETVDVLPAGKTLTYTVYWTVLGREVQDGVVYNGVRVQSSLSDKPTEAGTSSTVTETSAVTNAVEKKDYKLTVYYTDIDGKPLKETYENMYKQGEAFNVAVPTYDGYAQSLTEVAGIMPAHNVEITVFYYDGTLTVVYDYGEPLGFGGIVRAAGYCFE